MADGAQTSQTAEAPSSSAAVPPPPPLPEAFSWGSVVVPRSGDLGRVTRTTCGKDALLGGIASGTLAGVVSFAVSRKVMRSCNIAVGTFCVAAIGGWEFCRWKLEQDQAKMAEAMVLTSKLRERRAAQAEERRKQQQQQPQQQQPQPSAPSDS